MMKTHTITGGGGVQLHLVETGNPNGRPILFIHGFSQCGLAWGRQFESDLADHHRLVAMDLRGHGRSDKPRNAYADGQLWADDVQAVIQSLGLDRPILSGWSYAPLIILDYIRHHGEDAISGVQFVGGITKLGGDEAVSVLTPGFLNLIPGFFASDVEESARSMTSLLRLCFVKEPTAQDLYLMLGYNLSVPPHVRQALLSRSVDNDDLLNRMRTPVLLTHGINDAIVRPAAVNKHKARLPHAQVHMMDNAGHAPFWDDAANFNQRLHAFAEASSIRPSSERDSSRPLRPVPA
jgi:non-heme chloroperoxidase